MDNINLFVATETDAPILAEMNRHLINDEGHRNPMTIAELNCRMKSWLSKEYTAIICKLGSEVMGYVLWRKDEEYIYIRQFFIVARFRRKGIGQQFFVLLQKHVWESKTLRLEVLVENTQGLNFWRSLGFDEYCITLEHKNL